MGQSRLMGLWEVVTQVGGLAGLGSLVLGGYNTRHARNQDRENAKREEAKPALERQRQLRERLRQLLISAQTELKMFQKIVGSGDDPPGERDTIIAVFKDQLENVYLEGLTSPGNVWTSGLRRSAEEVLRSIDETRYYAERMRIAYSRHEVDAKEVEAATRRINVERSSLTAAIGKALGEFEEWISKLAQMNDGDEKLIEYYKR